ncbi:MAG: MSCRAMM family protein [Bacteroidota bacterium]
MGRSFFLWLIFSSMVFGASVLSLSAQETFTGTGAVSLRNRQAEVKPGGLVSNVVRVINTTGRMGEFTLRITTPPGWQVPGVSERTFTLGASDTLFFPVRVIALSIIQSNDPEIVNVSLLQFRNIVASENWTILPILRSDWSASVSRNRILLSADRDTASVKINVINTGDLPEILTLELTGGPQLGIGTDPGETESYREIQFRLNPLQDTIMKVFLRLMDNSEDQGNPLGGAPRSPRLRAVITSEPHQGLRAGSWRAQVDLRQVEAVWQENPSSYYSMPLTLNFNAFNVLDQNAYGDFSLYGFHTFNPETNLSYYFQSNFTSNFFDPQAFLGQYLQINFASRYFGVEVGNVSQSNDGANISGEGVKVYGKYGPHRLGVGVMQNPGVFEDPFHIRGLGAEYYYTTRKINAGTFLQLKENFTQQTKEEIIGAQGRFRLLQNQYMRASVNASRQTHNWNPDSVFSTTGLGYNLGLTGSYTKLSYNFLYSNHTAAHIVRGGNQTLSSRVGWRLSNRHNFFAAYSRNISDPDIYFRGELRQTTFYRSRQIYRVGYQNRGETSDFFVQPTYQQLEDPFLRYIVSGTELEYRVRDIGGLRFFATSFAGYTSLPDFERETLFTARIRAGIRFGDYNLNLRYYYGPFFSNELRRYAETGVISNRIGASFDFDKNLFSDKFLFRFTSMYNYTTFNQQHSASIRPELYYFPQSGLRFGVYARFFGIASNREDRQGLPDIDFEGTNYSSSRYEFGFSIKKDLNVPVSGRRFYDLTVVIHRGSEEDREVMPEVGLRDMWVRLQALDPGLYEGMVISQVVFEAVTDRDGKALFSNIPPGNYLVTVVPANLAGMRYEARTHEIVVSDDRTIYLSMDRGARVAGSIILQRDVYTRVEHFPLGGIRITATRDDGQQFTTLTSEDGQYDIYLPKGKYTISINENVFRDNFELLQNNVPIEIMYEQEIISVNFTARERTRQIRIQSPGENEPE